VDYPADWSRKRDADLRPHLSTVDMLMLGVQLSEAHLAHAYGLDDDMRGGMWLRKVSLRAGSTPQEDLLDLEGSARLRETRPASGSDGGFVSVYECAVGVMRARCEIAHPIARTDISETKYESLDDVLGDPAARYYGDGFKAQQHRIEGVHVDMSDLRSSASVGIDQLGSGGMPSEGTEGRYQPSLSLLDCFVVNLQLVQVMMYELDSVNRKDSNTLWMLRTTLETDRPHRPYGDAVPARAAITGKHLLPLRGGTWRNVDVRGDCGGVSLRSSFAHELPADALLEKSA
jgi:hypothetical protein